MCWVKTVRDKFGEPGEGIHASRTPCFDLAANDVLMTIIGALFLSFIIDKSFPFILFILVLLSIILHRFFRVNTTVNKYLFGVMQ